MANPVAPDISGFRDAQDALIDQLGQDVTFRVPRVATYPPGTQLDPETRQPYDPTVRPVAGSDGYDETVVRCAVVFRPLRRGSVSDPDRPEAFGYARDETVAVTFKVVDRPKTDGATHGVLNGLPYKITEILPDGLTEVQRYICFMEAL